MQFLHSQNILHLDLKSGNVLLDSAFHAQITDFGISRSHSNAPHRRVHGQRAVDGARVDGHVRARGPHGGRLQLLHGAVGAVQPVHRALPPPRLFIRSVRGRAAGRTAGPSRRCAPVGARYHCQGLAAEPR
mmetsp:Transcript_16068/g.41257  ORF Transcript_16068/g.41257 Transcript_16068/m.41257 type:complete len:131 (+) Transcript_16068:1569-1961(+)